MYVAGRVKGVKKLGVRLGNRPVIVAQPGFSAMNHDAVLLGFRIPALRSSK